MLTLEYVEKAARLMYQTAEADDCTERGLPALTRNVEHRSSEKTIKVRLDFFEDPETGDIRIVQR